MNLHYDEEGDYLEIFIEGQSPTYGEEIGDDITLLKSEKTGDVVGITILNFKQRTKSLQHLQLQLPFQVNFSAIPTS